MASVSVPGAARGRVRALGLAAVAAASLCSLLLTHPATANLQRAGGHSQTSARLADGSPVPSPHVLAVGGPGPSSPDTPPSSPAADGSPVPSPH